MLSQKGHRGMQDGDRDRSDEKPKYRMVGLSRYDDARQHKRQHETENS
jgi:hypothetical protein